MARLSHWYGRLLEALMLLACLLLLTMTLLIGADVLLRNIGLGGIAPSNELSEDIIYLVDAAGRARPAAAGPAHPRRHRAARAACRGSAGCSNGSAT